MKGESTAWYASFWRFCAAYLEERFGAEWCLSPEQSLSLHAGNWTVPRQLVVRSPGARNKVTETSAWHVAAGSSRRAARRCGPGGKGRPAPVLAGIRPDRVLSQLFFRIIRRMSAPCCR